jgi:hypothetical protein
MKRKEEEETKNRDITEETRESKADPEFPIHHKINVPIDYIPLSQNWLNLEVLRLWKCGIDICNGPYYSSHSLTFVNNNNNPIQKEGGEVLPTIAASIQFPDVEREEEEEKEEVQQNNNNSSSNKDNKKKRNKLTMTEFVQKYNSPSDSLSRHFSRPIFSDSCNKIFGEIQYIGILPANCITNSGKYQKL